MIFYGYRASEIMERRSLELAPHWFYKSARYKAFKLLVPSNWYRVRQYAKEILKPQES